MEDGKQSVVRKQPSYTVDTCCGCVPLKTGCYILGYLQLIALIITGIYYVRIMGAALTLMQRPEDKYRNIALGLMIAAIVTIVMCVITLPFNIALLVGLHKEKRKCVKAYIIFAAVGSAIAVIISFAKYFRGLAGFEELPISLVALVFNIYFILVFRSQYIKMGEAELQPPAYQESHQINTIK